MECVAELAWTGKFLYTSSLATFSTLRRLLSIVTESGQGTRLERFWNGCLIVALGRHCEASEEVGADSFITPPGTLCMHRKPNRVAGGLVFDWLTGMLRPVSHMNRSPVPIPNAIRIILRLKNSIICLILTFFEIPLNKILTLLKGDFWGFECPNDAQMP